MRFECDCVIRDLELHNSRLNKEDIIRAQAEANNLEFFEGCSLALDNLVTFGIKKVPEHPGPDGLGLSWEKFKEFLSYLQNRQLTGNEAKDSLYTVMGMCTQTQWNDWYRRILIKDLRCGVSEKTINKVLKDFPEIAQVPVFECMLSHDGANHEKKIAGKKILQPKLDGVRVLTVINAENHTVTQYTRNGKLLENFGHITSALEQHIDLFERSLILDGEMVSSSFQTLMKQVHRKDNVQASDARLAVFDIIPVSEFQQGRSVLGQRRRSNLLQSLEPIFEKVGSIDVVPWIEVDLDSFVGELEFKDYNKKMVEQGFEGVMIKDPDANYECKRSTAWLKIKPSLTVDLTVVAVEEGTGKNQGKLGALICEGTDQGKFISVNVGSGLTDEQRDEIWSDRESVIGQIVEIKADSITQSQDAVDTYSLRFPRFERFRGFKAGEKI